MPCPVTYAELEKRVAAQLKQDVGDMSADWVATIQDSLASAWNDVVAAIKGRGFSDAELAGWDRLREYVIDIGLFWALTKGGMLANYSDAFINKLDRRKELLGVGFTINGVLIQPGASAASVATPVVGRINERGFRFSMADDF